MKKYLDLEGFISFIRDLKVGEVKDVCTESTEDGSICSYSYKKDIFKGVEFVLYETCYSGLFIIQDTPAISIDDYIEGVFEALEMEGEYKIFIEE